MSPKNGRQEHSVTIMSPIRFWRSFRDVKLEVWAQGTANIVNTDAFSQPLGLHLEFCRFCARLSSPRHSQNAGARRIA